MLRQHLRLLFCHAFSHKHACAVLDDEGPAHNLDAYIEELRYDSLTVMWQREDAAQGGNEVDGVILVAVLRHSPEEDNEEHGEDYESDDQVRSDKHRKVVFLYSLKLTFAELRT